MGAVAVPLQVTGTVLNIGSMLNRASAEKKAGAIEARQLEKTAKLVEAVGTRKADEAKRESRYVQSKARTAMVAGGGTASDAGAIKTQAKLEAEGEYNALAALYEGKSEAAKLREQAKARRAGASSMSSALGMSAFGTMLSGVGKIFDD